MLKPRTLPLEDTNIALLGSKVEKECKLKAAQGEKQWAGVGKKEGLKIWRIESFSVVPWPEKEYGTFFSGDSYIVLRTYKKDPAADALSWDIFFWLGKNTSLDEAGTAAYKTVELDDVLGGAPVQHREVQDCESPGFLRLFAIFQTLEGGVASGFRHVTPETYEPRLLHVKGKKPVVARQVALTRDSLNSGDVFILDCGLQIYQFNGKDSTGFERAEAAKLARAIDDARDGRATVTVSDEGSRDAAFRPFWAALGGEGPIKSKEEGGADAATAAVKCLLRVSDASGTVKCEEIAKGAAVKRALLNSNDVFILDAGFQIFTWVGLKASASEKANGLHFAESYLKQHGRPLGTPIARVLEGAENEDFEASLR